MSTVRQYRHGFVKRSTVRVGPRCAVTRQRDHATERDQNDRAQLFTGPLDSIDNTRQRDYIPPAPNRWITRVTTPLPRSKWLADAPRVWWGLCDPGRITGSRSA